MNDDDSCGSRSRCCPVPRNWYRDKLLSWQNLCSTQGHCAALSRYCIIHEGLVWSPSNCKQNTTGAPSMRMAGRERDRDGFSLPQVATFPFQNDARPDSKVHLYFWTRDSRVAIAPRGALGCEKNHYPISWEC